MRFWVSWWSDAEVEEDAIPFDYWISGWKFKPGMNPFNMPDGDDGEGLVPSICAVIDAESEDAVWGGVSKFFPDYEVRFCEERDDDYSPGDRFQGGTGRTSLA